MTRARLRGGAIVAALKNRKTIEMRIDPRSPCTDVPNGCDRLRLSLDMKPRPNLRVSTLGIFALIERFGVRHRILVPWHAIVQWRAH